MSLFGLVIAYTGHTGLHPADVLKVSQLDSNLVSNCYIVCFRTCLWTSCQRELRVMSHHGVKRQLYVGWQTGWHCPFLRNMQPCHLLPKIQLYLPCMLLSTPTNVGYQCLESFILVSIQESMDTATEMT